MNKAERAAVKNLQNPHAWNSDFEFSRKEKNGQRSDSSNSLIWKTKTAFYGFLGEYLATGQFGRNPPDVLKEVAERVIHMTPRAQAILCEHLQAMKPDGLIVHNRLGSKEVQRLAMTVGQMIDEASALNDGEE